jgi:hypothetical protein
MSHPTLFLCQSSKQSGKEYKFSSLLQTLLHHSLALTFLCSGRDFSQTPLIVIFPQE